MGPVPRSLAPSLMRPHTSITLAALASLVSLAPARAQTPEKDVVAVVQKVFDAMRTRDTSLLRIAFDTSGRLISVATRDGKSTIRAIAPMQFGAAIAGAPAGDVWNERIYDPEVRIDGDVAQVWAYYTFHRNQAFS